MDRPVPIDEEIQLDRKKIIVSKTDPKGYITYANDVFQQVSGYSEEELMGANHNIVRHPDMPKIAFKLMWDRINQGKNFKAVVKNLAKDGRYYWVITDFEPLYDAAKGTIVEYTAYRMAAPRKAIAIIEPIYKTLCDVELQSNNNLNASYVRLQEILDSQNITYDDFIEGLQNQGGMFVKIYKALKKAFKLKK